MTDSTTAAAPSRGYTMSKDAYAKRLSRIEGQVRGIRRMIDEDTYCIDVLTQVSAATKALQSVAVGLLDEHVRHCVRNAVVDGDEAGLEKMMEINATYSAEWPNITRKRESPPDADEFKGVDGKFDKYFSAEPGEGD